MIQKTRVYIEDTTNEIRELERQALELGIPLDPKDLTKDTGYGGSAWKQPHLAQYEKDKAKKASKSGKALDDADGEADGDDEEDMDEEALERRREIQEQREFITELEGLIAQETAKYEMQTNKILKQKIGRSVQQLKQDLALKKASIGETEGEAA